MGPITIELVNLKLSNKVFDLVKKLKFFIKDFNLGVKDQSFIKLSLIDTLSMLL